MDQHNLPLCTNQFISAHFYAEDIIQLCYKTSYLNEEVICSEPSPLVQYCSKLCFGLGSNFLMKLFKKTKLLVKRDCGQEQSSWPASCLSWSAYGLDKSSIAPGSIGGPHFFCQWWFLYMQAIIELKVKPLSLIKIYMRKTLQSLWWPQRFMCNTE